MTRRQSFMLTAVIFLIMGITMATAGFGFKFEYSNPDILRVAIFGEVLMTLLIVVWVRRQSKFESVGFSKLKSRGLVWYVPVLLVVLLSVGLIAREFIVSSVELSASTTQLLGIALVTAMLVGFNEETIFRGVLIRAFHPESHPFKALFVSATFFSAFHLLNLFAFIPLSSMLYQLGNTFVFGLFFGLLALKLNNLWPLIILHGFWDFVSLGGDIIDIELTIPLLIVQSFVAVSVVLQLILLKRHDLSHLKSGSLSTWNA
ncbi:CPBP family intramembrane glutamic endopeptidase [Exiguobacterium flavidum]|uniref:CPBP family intramembrane glutamic endopeptidase n=1 Tax=Exiguobacterium flavidum TaxID=2184695 RepID=UPI000DF72C6C|nr:type II CAAX endopeptidase family protein [Exiguobacterium flavidum]